MKKKLTKTGHFPYLATFIEFLLRKKVPFYQFCLIGLITLSCISNVVIAQQQGRKLSGKISDNQGLPLPGASVIVKGTTVGVVSDMEGAFTIAVPSDAKVLTISFIGMKNQEITLGTKTNFSITMESNVIDLEEVVAVGYGTQKRANLTGSVSSVTGTEMAKRPVPSVQNLLEGKASGLQVTQSGATPGADGATIRIRGFGTFSSTGSNPLVLIDRVEGNMSYLDADNIEDVSVLKDAASAAIYGARAANGVILVTTKRGKAGSVSIEYHGTFAAQDPTRLPDLLYNSADYMQYWNEANVRAGMVPYFTQTEIDAFRNHPNDPVKYPNFNWEKHMYKTGFTQNHHLSINGGTKKQPLICPLAILINPESSPYLILSGTICN